MLRSGREVYGSVIKGRNNPRNERRIEEAAVERNESAWKGVEKQENGL